MIYVMAILVGLLTGAALGFGVGFGAAELFTKIGGSREGANAMAGFFYIGPFGLLAGFLLGFGGMVRFGGGNLSIANWTCIAGGVVLALGGLLVLISVADSGPRRQGRSKFDFRFEAEVPKSMDLEKLRWEYFGHAEDGAITTKFRDPVCTAERCVVNGVMQMVDSPEHRRVWIAFGEDWKQRFDVPFPFQVEHETEWSAWKAGEHEVRFRWRMETVR